ncbi:MAG: hypothetical protein V7677_00685 [Motiliproteus sp.]
MTKWLIIALAAASLTTTLYQYLRSKKRKTPLSAQNDVKARRLWQCDPQAYERKFGAADREIEANTAKKSKP